MAWSKMVSMELDDEDQVDFCAPIACEMPRFPYELRIALTEKTLEKLDLEADCSVGDIIDLRAFARVTSISVNQMENGDQRCRVELQIEDMGVENEMDE